MQGQNGEVVRATHWSEERWGHGAGFVAMHLGEMLPQSDHKNHEDYNGRTVFYAVDSFSNCRNFQFPSRLSRAEVAVWRQ